MKKSNRPSGQKTLFQTWNKQTKKTENQNSKSLFQTWGTSTTNTSTAHLEKRDTESLEDLINIDEEDDDNEFLAAIDQIEQCENATNSHDVGNLSFSASTNDDGSDVIAGFDCSAGNSWIYPTNYPLRDYQFNIVQKALFHNTLVTLPTGLGKTFIAAVVMYNFYRWYPQGKIIFMAPTKPLVAQQIDACYNIMGIPRQDTAEMTGNMAPPKREVSWKEKRVFFLTPQVFQNDLSRGSCRADDVVCLVFDEAHKALGNHSYCQVVREVLGYTQNFRVLALSATPGDGIKAVQQVITNLLVSHIELRSEDSADIKPYTHERQVEKIVVQLGDELEFFKTKFLRVLRLVVNRLSGHQVLWMRDAERVSKCMLLAAREQFRNKCAAGQQPRHHKGAIEGDFAVALSLYHGYDLLMQHGLLPFYNFIKGIVDGSKGISRAKTELTRNPDFVGILDDLRDQIEPQPAQSDGHTNGSNVKSSFVGHPKLVKLKDIVLEHFRACDSAQHAGNTKGSRVMIFSQFRDSVQEISRMLSEYKPLVKAMSFIGQQSKGNSSKGLTQKEQIEVIRQFRNGGYNTLVATCVGEEGLDIGEVDLIVCFDASASPIRLVQRMGRTGRKRDGRIVVLVTEGKEEQIYQRSQHNKSNIHKTILESARTLDLYMENPRMVPKNVKPVCQKLFITVDAKSPKSKSKSARKSTDGDIKKLFSACSRRENGFLSPQELRYWNDNFKLPNHEAGLTPSKTTPMRPQGPQSTGERYLQTEPSLSLVEWTAWQTPLQQVYYVDHSKRSRHFTEILEFCDFRRECGDDEDGYDLEMQSFLNREDILEPGEKEAASECVLGNGVSIRNNGQKGKEVVVVDDDEDGGEMSNMVRKKDGSNNRAKMKNSSNNMASKKDESRKRKSTDFGSDTDDDDDGGEITNIARTKDDNMARKDSESSRKRKSLDFGSDIDDDFEDILGESNAPEKTVKIDQNKLHCDPSLGGEPEENSSAKKQLESSHALTKNQSVSYLSLGKNQSSNTLTKNQSESKHVKNQSKCDNSTAEHIARDQEWNDDELDSDNDLSDLFDIPSSQRQRKLTRGPEHLKSESRISEGPISEALPDAPSLDTLLDLSALNAGEGHENQSNLQEEESDHDFFPSMFAETTKDRTYSNSKKHFVQSSNVGLCEKSFFDEVSDNERLSIKKGGFSEKPRSSKKSENKEEQDVSASKYEKSGSIDKGNFGKTCSGRSVKLDLPQERLSSGNTKVRNRDIGTKGEGNGTDSFCVGIKVISKGKTFGTKIFENEIQDFDAELANSFFDGDEHEIDRALCDVQTPCVFDDDGVENMSEKNKEQTSKQQGTIQHLSHRNLYSEDKNARTQKNNVETPCLFDDEEFENRTSEEEITGARNTDKCRSPRTLYSEIDNISIKKKVADFDEKLDRSMSQRIPLLEQNRNSKITNESTRLKSRVNERSLNKIRSFFFSKPTTDQSKSLNAVTSEPRDLNLPDEYGHDVVAPSPLRGNHRSSYCRKVDKTRSFRGESFSMKRVCSEKGEEIMKTCQNRGRMLKLKSKERNNDLKSSEGVQVDAEMVKGSSFKNDTLFGKTENKEQDTTRMVKGIESFNNEMKSDKHPTPLNKSSSLKRTSFSGQNQNKVESNYPQVAESLYTSLGTEFADEELDHACLNATIKPSSQFSCGEKNNVCLQNIEVNKEHINKVEIRKENSLFKSPPRTDRKSMCGFKTCGLNNVTEAECGEELGESGENLGESVEDSPLVMKAKGKMRYMSLRNRMLESDYECGVESSDNDGECGEENQTRKESEVDFQDEVRVVYTTKKRSFLRNQTKNIHEISDSDDEFDLQENLKVKRKRKLPVYGGSNDNKPKKRRPQLNDFLDDEAEVSEDEINDSHDQNEEDLEEMEDSFIDDRSQLTQRSPLTTMKEKKRDKSVNMMDIYRTSLLTPHRQQLRFQTPALHRYKNRYKMVYDQAPPAKNTFTSPTDDDNHHDVSMETEESDEDTMVEDGSVAGPPSVSPEESQIVVRKNRRGTRRVLAESYFASPKAADSELQTKRSEHQTKLSEQNKSRVRTRDSCVEVKDTESIVSSNSKKSGADDTIFKRPRNTAPINDSRGLERIDKVSTGYSGENENIDDILAALNDSDDETLMMEINALEDSTLEKNSANSYTSESKQRSGNGMNERSEKECDSSGTENLKSNNGQGAGRRLMAESYMRGVQEKSRIGLNHAGNKCEPIFKTTSCNARTSVNQDFTSTSTCSKNNGYTGNGSAKLSDCKTLSTGAKPSEIHFKEDGIRKEITVDRTKCQPQNSYNSKFQSVTAPRTGNKPTNVSPLFPPLSTITSSKDTSSYTHGPLEKTTGRASGRSKLDTSKAVSENIVNPTKLTSPASTATQRDKNKVTILVGSKEVSNCQIVSLLRRKHNIKTVVSQITGCDYIVSTRMAVERKFVSDISNQANYNKLTARVRELCDLYDRPCIVIEKDRVKNGESEVKCEVRSKYFDRILACLAQTYIKVLFTENQEGTSDILASLAQVEETKNHAIIYPLPLSKEKEQVVKFLSSIPRTSYITAISLCYHNKTLQEIISSSAEELVKRVKTLSLKRAKDILKFLQHGFKADMVNTT